MSYVKTYCINTGCPYTDCEKHPKRVVGLKGSFYFKDFDATCKKYISWLAYSNYEKYRELKGDAV